MGDDTARGLGSRVEAVRGSLLLTGVAVATASAGPIGFVALTTPQIARRLVGGRSLALVPSAACGALIVVTAHLVDRRVFAATELPVGVITAIVGAPYLLYLLTRDRPSLRAERLGLAYDDRLVVEDLTVTIPRGGFTVIVEANACGKSTLLASHDCSSRRPATVLLDGADIHRRPTKEVAARLGMLPRWSTPRWCARCSPSKRR